MSASAWCLAAITALTAWLAFRDPALDTAGRRAVLAGVWLVLPTLIILIGQPSSGALWADVAILATASLATAGRPALLLETLLPASARADKRLTRRGRVGMIIFIAVAIGSNFVTS